MGSKKDLYAQDGVNVSAGDALSKYAGEICFESFENSPFVRVNELSGGFYRGVRTYSFVGLPYGCELDMTSDGNGTKVILTALAGTFHCAGNDLVAMSCMDIVRNGGLPLVLNNVLDVSSVGEIGSKTFEALKRLLYGLGVAARVAGIVLFRGETAELGVCVGSESPGGLKFNWSATTQGVYHPDKMITGEGIAPGQVVIAFEEEGFRANGISSVRKAFAKKFGPEWWSNPDAKPYISDAAHPSTMYESFFTKLNGWHGDTNRPDIKIHKLIHLTGGAFEGKLGNDVLFPRGLSADLDYLYEPPDIMQQCAEWRGMSAEDCYKTWNGGQGALAIVEKNHVSALLDYAYESDICAGVCGRITKSDQPQICIQSKYEGGGEVIFSMK